MDETKRNILAVIGGVFTSFILGAILIFITVMSIGSSKNGFASFLFFYVAIFIPSFSGGFVCGYLSTRKDSVLVFVTSFISVFLLLLNNDFKITLPIYRNILLFLLIIIFTYIGGIVGKKINRKLSN
jgi:peptidoglycan/LPS O-acetylase OafA/YrhL